MSTAILKIRPLIVAASGHLHEKKFSAGMIEKYIRLWNRIAVFMTASGSDIYDREVGRGFLDHLFGRFSYSELSPHQKAIARKVQYLTNSKRLAWFRGNVNALRQYLKAGLAA